jgi:DNA polymerase
MVEQLDTVLVEEVLQLRLDYSQAAVKKFAAVTDKSNNGRTRETLQFCGASRTGRWAGRGLQLQNLKRPLMDDPDFWADLVASDPNTAATMLSLEDLGSLVRSAIKAPVGKKLVVADLSSIEVWVAGWMTGCKAILKAARDGLDPYKVFASIWFGVLYEKVTKEQRRLSKPVVLGAQYRMWADGMRAYAESMGIEMSRDLAESAVRAWRMSHPEVVKSWGTLEAHFRLAIQNPGSSFGALSQVAFDPPFLRWRLPSGRTLYYYQPEVSEGQISYMGQNSYTGQWERIETHGGKIFENGDQAISRDVLVEGLWRYHEAGGTIIGHVHDEIIAEEDEWEADAWLDTLTKRMSAPVAWAPGLKLGAAGYVANRYRKD